ncbi:MAG: transporter [Coleofasciculus sp. G1-WW12-02]|uniref:transporter n=1 Tax=Coleofasciculus sp. G1-WW12-02 TaxID=3068483 RepID=UPI0032FA4242
MKHSLQPLTGLTVIVLTIATFGQSTAQASDHFNLEEGLPIEVEDAYPVPYQGLEVQGQFRYDRAADGEDQFILEPRLEYGFAPNWQGKITVPFEFGAKEDGIGDVGVEVFYNFNTETLKTPAFAASLSADLPTGNDSAGVDPTLKLIATKTLGTGANLDRLHLNVAYGLNDQRQDGERRDRLSGVLGYSRRLNSEALLLTDFVYEQELEEDKEAFLLELGVRYQLTPLNVLSVGVGVGLSEESPDFRVTAGFQQSL